METSRGADGGSISLWTRSWGDEATEVIAAYEADKQESWAPKR